MAKQIGEETKVTLDFPAGMSQPASITVRPEALKNSTRFRADCSR